MDEDLLQEITSKDILHWNYRNYTTLPSELKIAGSHVEDLYLKHNKLKKLPKWIGDLLKLTNLYLHGNDLDVIPDEIALLKNLTLLDLSWNHLTNLPDKISKLCNLTSLCLENNSLTELPADIGLLPSLSILTVTNNRLQNLPDSLGCCYSLQQLYADNNKLMCLPSNLALLPQLDFLSVSDNEMLYFPSIVFEDDPVINFSNNPLINYISFDLYVNVTDPYTHRPNSNFFSYNHDTNFRNGLQLSDVSKLNNIVLRVPNWMKYANVNNNITDCPTLIVLPGQLKRVYQPKDVYIPSLFEMLLRKQYFLTTYAKRTAFYYGLDDGVVPRRIKQILVSGPAAKCHSCRSHIFTESIIWIVPRISLCSICRETELLTVVYFCSSFCVKDFKISESNYEERGDKLSSCTLSWTRVH